MLLHQFEGLLDQITHVVLILLRVINLVSEVFYMRYNIYHLLLRCRSKFITGRICL